MSIGAPVGDSVKPTGFCIQAFTASTMIADTAPLTATATPHHQCCFGGSRSQPYRYSPRKIASMKNA